MIGAIEDKQLAQLAEEHGLTPEETGRVREILGRTPTLTELGVFSVMWSEHCSYKSSRAYLGRFPTEGPRVIQGPGENAGIVDIGGGWACAFKMESHNHPSFIEPHQGAATGVGGILRDVFTMGARPVAALDALWFGRVDHPRTGYLVRGVVDGISRYGNCFGVPTVGGSTWFAPAFDQNILVNAMAVGVVKSDRIFLASASGAGNAVLYVGAKTGRDGIHGATMASEQFEEGADQKRPTVQVGDPFTEKLLLEALLELFQTDLVLGIQDMGAAGLTSSSVEMADRGGAGIELWLDRVPVREQEMTPYELLLSESQERMLLVVEKGREGEVQKIFEKWDLSCVEVGTVTDTGHMVVTMDGDVYADIPVGPIGTQAPKYERPAKAPAPQRPVAAEDVELPGDLGVTLRTMLASPNLASKHFIYRQYDHQVQTNTVVVPGGDASVVRVRENGKALALTADCNARYCRLAPKSGAEGAVAEAARNVAAVGGEPLAITDCLNFGSPETPEVMWQFQEAVEGISLGCEALDIAVVSGNVSFYNETDGQPIDPTPAIGMVGLVEDPAQARPIAFQAEGDEVLLLGHWMPVLGGSEYLATVHQREEGTPPAVNWSQERATSEFVREQVRAGRLESAHDLSEGGLAIALAECCLAGKIGVRADLPSAARVDVALFGETHGSFVVSSRGDAAAKVLEAAKLAGVPAVMLGAVGGDALEIVDTLTTGVPELAEASLSLARTLQG